MTENAKKELRTKIKTERLSMNKSVKSQLDNLISENLIKSNILSKSKLVLIYVSTDVEIDTSRIIDYCILNSIKIAIPRCVGKRKMNFYFYDKNTRLEKSKYGIYEPIDDKNNMVKGFENAVCVVPGLAFDKNGFRLGYGGGFYDTFLAENINIKTVGIIYNKNLYESLPKGIYDKQVDYIVTENKMEACNG